VAEDHAVSRRVMELILEPLGVDLVLAEDGAEAVDAFAGMAFDVIVLDKRMPNLDGLEAARRIRALEAAAGRSRTPILLLSADAGSEEAAMAIDAGCDRHLTKPISPERLIASLHDILAVAGARQAV